MGQQKWPNLQTILATWYYVVIKKGPRGRLESQVWRGSCCASFRVEAREPRRRNGHKQLKGRGVSQGLGRRYRILCNEGSYDVRSDDPCKYGRRRLTVESCRDLSKEGESVTWEIAAKISKWEFSTVIEAVARFNHCKLKLTLKTLDFLVLWTLLGPDYSHHYRRTP